MWPFDKVTIEEALKTVQTGRINAPERECWQIDFKDMNLNRIRILSNLNDQVDILINGIGLFSWQQDSLFLSIEEQIQGMLRAFVKHVLEEQPILRTNEKYYNTLGPTYLLIQTSKRINDTVYVKVYRFLDKYKPRRDMVILFSYISHITNPIENLCDYIWGASDVAL